MAQLSPMQWCARVNQLLRQRKPLDSDSVKWEESDDGMRAHIDVVTLTDAVMEEVEEAEESAGIDPYFFEVTAKDADEVSILAGKVINGTTVSSISETDHTIGTVNGTYYFYIQVWYNSTWKSSYASGTDYPDQSDIDDGGTDYPCWRVLLAEVVVSGNVVQDPTQVWPGHELHNPNIAD